MRNYIWSFSLFFGVVFASFSQTKTIEKGTYITTEKGQKIKLNLLDDNKYELVFYSGEYKIKGDSLSFIQSTTAESAFNVVFNTGKKSKKVKIKFIDPSYYPLYLGTQNGSEPVQYQRITDVKSKQDPEWKTLDVEFEIDRADYLYLVYEGYETESQVSKFALPKDASEVVIKYELSVLGDLNIAGVFDPKTKQLKVYEKSGKNPLVFLNEKDVKPETIAKIKPLEEKKVLNWDYPGKEPLVTEDFGYALDSTAVAVDADQGPKFDFKLKVENSLKAALAATKSSANKFLVVVVDSKNPSAKADFDTFIKDQETQISYSMYEAYDPQFDLFNYYLAGADDKKWLKSIKNSDDPGIIILNQDGEVVVTAKSKLAEKQNEFSYYDGLAKKLARLNAFQTFSKTIKNKKATDADLVAAFNKAAVMELPYDYETDYDVTAEANPTDFKLIKTNLDKKEVAQNWKKLIEAHQKDTKPNLYLVETILKEIKNQGFSKQFFKDDKVLNDTDFLAIDYLIKHYDAIEAGRLAFIEKEGETHFFGPINSEISAALQQNKYTAENGIETEKNPVKTISVYKKLIAAGKGNFDSYQNYFSYLEEAEDKDGSNTTYLKEFSTYFNANLATDKGSVIEKLDEMFSGLEANSEYSYNGWNSFKEYHSNLCNSAAWTVVSKPGNLNFLKSAITWSEYSLAVTKNNPYYLDTLAQLYYKDGQKEKAIQTQTLAVTYLTPEVEEQTAIEIKETLSKMQNGTY